MEQKLDVGITSFVFLYLNHCRVCAPSKSVRECVGTRGKKKGVKDDSKNLRLKMKGE